MTNAELVNLHPDLYLDVIRDGVELALNGMTEFQTVTDVTESLQEVKKKWDNWEQQEEEFLRLI